MAQRRTEQNANGCLSVFFKILDLVFGERLAASLPYRKKESILTPIESRFYVALNQAIDDMAVIVPKVSLQDIFSINDKDHYRAARNRISTRHVDFLVCELSTFRPLFGVELDDSSHKASSRKQSDDFKNSVFEAAMLPLVRVPARQQFNVDELKTIIQPYFEKREEINIELPPICPNCGIPMVRRTAKHGDFKGGDFWACPNYPRCTEKKNIPSPAIV